MKVYILFWIFLFIKTHSKQSISSNITRNCTAQNQVHNHVNCDEYFFIRSGTSPDKLYLVSLQDIKPYTEMKHLCFFINPKDQSNLTDQFSEGQITQIIKKKLHETNILFNQQQKSQYFLRIDHMPNECLNIKNDVVFRNIYVPILRDSSQHSNKIERLLIAQVSITRQCANLNDKTDQQSSLENKRKINLIIEVKQTIFELFGFPIYIYPFAELFYLFLVNITGYLSWMFLLQKKYPQGNSLLLN